MYVWARDALMGAPSRPAAKYPPRLRWLHAAVSPMPTVCHDARCSTSSGRLDGGTAGGGRRGEAFFKSGWPFPLPFADPKRGEGPHTATERLPVQIASSLCERVVWPHLAKTSQVGLVPLVRHRSHPVGASLEHFRLGISGESIFKVVN